MSNPITDARMALAALLGELGYRVYPNPVENPIPPCIQIFAGGDWLINPRLKGKRDVRLQMRLSAATVAGNDEALSMLEQMIWDVTSLVPTGGIISAPRLDANSSTEAYVVDLATILNVEGNP